MTIISNEQVGKLFYMAGLEVPVDIKSEQISRALIEIEKKLTTSSCYASKIDPNTALNVLIVDDLEVSIYQLNLLLTQSGYNVYIARSSDEALDQFKKRNFDYVLLDLYIPEPKDGLAILDTFHNSEKTKRNKTKIIVISGTDNQDLIDKCLENGADEFINKTSEWHKNVLQHLKQLEVQHHSRPKLVSNYIDQEKNVVVVSINYSYNSRTSLELEKEFISLINTGYHNIILDMNKFSRIDSKGISMLIFGYTICSEHGGNFKLLNVNDAVEESLAYVHLNTIIRSFKDKKSALQSFA